MWEVLFYAHSYKLGRETGIVGVIGIAISLFLAYQWEYVAKVLKFFRLDDLARHYGLLSTQDEHFNFYQIVMVLFVFAVLFQLICLIFMLFLSNDLGMGIFKILLVAPALLLMVPFAIVRLFTKKTKEQEEKKRYYENLRFLRKYKVENAEHRAKNWHIEMFFRTSGHTHFRTDRYEYSVKQFMHHFMPKIKGDSFHYHLDMYNDVPLKEVEDSLHYVKKENISSNFYVALDKNREPYLIFPIKADGKYHCRRLSMFYKQDSHFLYEEYAPLYKYFQPRHTLKTDILAFYSAEGQLPYATQEDLRSLSEFEYFFRITDIDRYFIGEMTGYFYPHSVSISEFKNYHQMYSRAFFPSNIEAMKWSNSIVYNEDVENLIRIFSYKKPTTEVPNNFWADATPIQPIGEIEEQDNDAIHYGTVEEKPSNVVYVDFKK